MFVLDSFVSDRVNKMVEKGMVNEVRDFYNPNADYSKGIRRAIGVPEFDTFFRVESFCDGETQANILGEAIDSIKINTSRLARCQLKKINRLSDIKGWSIHRLDATNVFRKLQRDADDVDAEWENTVAAPAVSIVGRFLYNLESEAV
ncbi:adenylate isopentenyltransferase 3 chloroplastic [Phtheirospermum japonicum]|uniref:adenylate dimethylallyltransferase (ADP/ATP-dependent) n=1 Tax=Phtheirospermum japonicum TaxID=374723 RepID=A0A830CPM5_9LAMI|nr:adenylate isopentenyltransferase 3 chloroplastic [Phtheirospermum japonicum]